MATKRGKNEQKNGYNAILLLLSSVAHTTKQSIASISGGRFYSPINFTHESIFIVNNLKFVTPIMNIYNAFRSINNKTNTICWDWIFFSSGYLSTFNFNHRVMAHFVLLKSFSAVCSNLRSDECRLLIGSFIMDHSNEITITLQFNV